MPPSLLPGDTAGLRLWRQTANGLAQHLTEAPGPDRPRGTVLLLHGYLDEARSFTHLLHSLGAAGYRVLAPDFRGHGRSAWAPPGAYYHFPDYLADLDALVRALDLPRVRSVAHSMGGSVATRWAAVRPDRVQSLCLLEGIGPPAMPANVAVDRTAAWLDALARHDGRPPRVLASLDEAVRRLRVSHAHLDEAILRAVAGYATEPAPEGGLRFRFDRLHQTVSPGRHDAEAFEHFIDRLACPVLLVDGGDTALWPDYDARTARFRDARRATLPDAGHMMHWTQPEALAACVRAFLDQHSAA